MTTHIHHIIFLLSAFSPIQNNDIITISMSPSMDNGPINWKQTVIISCSWTPGDKMQGDVLVGNGISVWSDELYGDVVNLSDPEERLYFSSDDGAGTASLTIKDITGIDARRFTCSVSRKGSSDSITLQILEPPLTGVTDLAADPDFTSVTLTWAAVSGATNYNVGWRSAASGDWNTVNVTTTSHQFEGLSVASDFQAKVSASNRAGIRDGIQPATVTFTTKDNRPPLPVGELRVEEAKYNQTRITLTWNTQENRAEKRIVTNILVSATRERREEEVLVTQELGSNATSTTIQLPGPGNYLFYVSTLNNYTAGVNTTESVSHTVKETTKPPTEPPKNPFTTAPTTQPDKLPDPTPDKSAYEVEDEKPLSCGPSKKIKLSLGTSLQLVCKVPDGAKYTVDQVSWTQQVVNGKVLNQTEITKMGAAVKSDVSLTISTLQINKFAEKLTGVWTCTESVHSSNCTYHVTLLSTQSSSVCSSVSTFLLLILFFIYV